MTFPLIAAGLIRRYAAAPGATVSWLYCANSLGGVLGILATGWFVVVRWGLPGALLLAGGISLLLALLVGWQAHRTVPRPRSVVDDRCAPETGEPKLGPDAGGRGLLVIALLTGLASFFYEIGWIRLLNLVLGSSTHAFELMLCAFILGLAAGGGWIRFRLQRVGAPWRYLGWVQLVMGALALFSLSLYGATFSLMEWGVSTLPKTEMGYWGARGLSLAIALGLMLPVTFCAGMTLPLITHILYQRGWRERSVGSVLSCNMLGAIAGTLLAVHLLIERVGAQGVVGLGALVDILAGLWLLQKSRSEEPAGGKSVFGGRAWGLGSLLIGVPVAGLLWWEGATPLAMASGVYRTGWLLPASAHEVLAHEEGKTATISLVGSALASGGRAVSIRTNGKPDAMLYDSHNVAQVSDDQATTTLLADIPLLLHGEVRRAAVIGMGAGITVNTLLSDPALVAVDVVEIEPKVVELARQLAPFNQRVFSDPRSQLVLDDAKSFFSRPAGRYDLIVSNPSNPWVSGVSSLFTQEFYRQASQQLNPGGLFAQWIQLYEIDVALVGSIIKALGAVFSQYELFVTAQGDLLVVAGNGPGSLYAPLRQKTPSAGLAVELARAGVLHGDDLATRWVGNRELLEALFEAQPLPANSDYFPVLDQRAERARYLRLAATELLQLTLTQNFPLRQLLSGEELTQGWSRFSYFTNLPQTGAYVYAAWLRDLLLKRGTPHWGDGQRPPQDWGRAAKQQVAACQRGGDPAARLDRLNGLMLDMLPYLNAGEMAAVWQVLETLDCAAGLSGHERGWIALYRGVAARDHQRILETADRLRAASGTLPVEVEKFLLRLQIVSGLALHSPRLAGWWQAYQELPGTTGDSSLLLTALQSLSLRQQPGMAGAPRTAEAAP